MNRPLLILALSLLITKVFAQDHKHEIPCYTDELLSKQIESNPDLLLKQMEHEDELYNKLHVANKRSSAGCEVRIIPTVFHIIHNNGSENISEETVNDYIEQVNKVWRFQNVSIDAVDTQWHNVVTDMQVELRLAKLDEDGNATNGIVRVESALTNDASDDVKALSQWDPSKYLNIYVVRSIGGAPPGSQILGYAYFPWMESASQPPGIVIRSDVLNRATLSHELGHYLDLYHPFQSGCGTSCTTTGDRVCDTPPVSASSRGCNKLQNSCSNDQPNIRDMIENIMDYSDCRNIMTKGQKQRVDNTFDRYRSELVSIANLRATGVIDSNQTVGEPIAEFEIENSVLCEGSSLSFQDLSCTNPDSTEYKWFFPSGVPSAAFTSNPTVTYNKAGQYDVTLIISNRAGTDTMVKTKLITVMPKESAIKAPLYQGFEDDNFPYENWSTASPDDMQWERTTDFSNGGDACLTIKNYGTAKLGEQYVFSTPPLDLRSSKSYELNFDLAYARFSELSTERLEIYAVDACRKVNLLRYSGTANSMRTTDDVVTIPFKPTETEWKSFKVDMNIAKSLTSASIEFRFTSYGEQNIFLDNIAIGSWPLSVERRELADINVWPNPTNNLLNISGLTNYTNAQVDLVDLSGRVVLSTSETTGNNVSLNLKSIENGIYLVKIQTENGSFFQKIIKK